MSLDENKRLADLRPNLQRRAVIYDIIRAFFNKRHFLEVETPVRVPAIAPETYIVPYESEGWFLSTSPELHMKRMLAAGYEKLFQFSRCFRKGERGHWHNPEFTMLEWYRAGADYNDIIRDTENLVLSIASKLGPGNILKYQRHSIDISLPWPRVPVREAFIKAAGWDPAIKFDPRRFDIDFVEKVLPSFDPNRPTVFTDYPAACAALARLKPVDDKVAERAEIFIGGLEIANIYSELVDAAEQEKRFREAIEEIRRERNQNYVMPESFMQSVPHLPPCGGIALGVDRLVMLFCDASSIDEVMTFTKDSA